MAIASNFSKNAKYPIKPLASKIQNKEASQEEIMEKFMRQVNLINKQFGGEEAIE